MSSETLKEVFDALLLKIARKRGAPTGPRSIGAPLRSTNFGQRKNQYFGPRLEPIQALPKRDFVAYRKALAAALDSDGDRCLDERDLDRLDAAYERYCALVVRPVITPQRFHTLLRRHGFRRLDSEADFMRLLHEAVIRPNLRGEREVCANNLIAVNTAFMNRDDVFTSDETIRDEQYGLLLACGQFCMHRQRDLREQYWITVMQQELQKKTSPLILHGLLSAEHSNDPGSDAAFRLLKLTREGLFKGWGKSFGTGMSYAKAARRAIILGWDLDDCPPAMEGMSVSYALSFALDDHLAHDRPVEAAIDTTIGLFADAAAGRCDKVWSGAAELRHRARSFPDPSPFLDAAILLVESRAFYSASRGGDKNHLIAACGKVADLNRLYDEHDVRLIGKDYEQYIGVLRGDAQRTLGTLTYMGE